MKIKKENKIKIGVISSVFIIVFLLCILLRENYKEIKEYRVAENISKNLSSPVLEDNIFSLNVYDDNLDKNEVEEILKSNKFIPTSFLVDESGRIGSLVIKKINLNSRIYECKDEMEAMTKGIAHFTDTTTWNGNVCLSAHNINFDGSDGIFKNLYKLKKGDEIVFQTEIGERIYKVEMIKEIEEIDWSLFRHTNDNRLTLLTCITGKETKRLCVQAIEKEL